jgi:hypothetical protein
VVLHLKKALLVSSQGYLKSWTKTLMSAYYLGFDILLCGLMLSTMIVWMIFVFSNALEFEGKTTYNVYDGATTSNARYFLPKKVDPIYTTMPNGTSMSDLDPEFAALGWNTSLSPGGLGFETPISTGYPGRWVLDSNDSEFDQFAGVMSQAREMSALWTTYTLLQSVVLFLLITRLLVHLQFQVMVYAESFEWSLRFSCRCSYRCSSRIKSHICLWFGRSGSNI